MLCPEYMLRDVAVCVRCLYLMLHQLVANVQNPWNDRQRITQLSKEQFQPQIFVPRDPILSKWTHSSSVCIS